MSKLGVNIGRAKTDLTVADLFVLTTEISGLQVAQPTWQVVAIVTAVLCSTAWIAVAYCTKAIRFASAPAFTDLLLPSGAIVRVQHG